MRGGDGRRGLEGEEEVLGEEKKEKEKKEIRGEKRKKKEAGGRVGAGCPGVATPTTWLGDAKVKGRKSRRRRSRRRCWAAGSR